MEVEIRLRERAEALETLARRERWIEDHVHLLGEYTDVLQEIDRRVAARTMLWQINPPEGLLAEIGSRSESSNPKAWDATVAVYARTRLDAGSDVDLLDPQYDKPGNGVTWSSSPSKRQPRPSGSPDESLVSQVIILQVLRRQGNLWMNSPESEHAEDH